MLQSQLIDCNDITRQEEKKKSKKYSETLFADPIVIKFNENELIKIDIEISQKLANCTSFLF